MDFPEAYNYHTQTFDPDDALRHVLKYPAFANALTHHQDELHNYLSMSKLITDLMEDSFQARQVYQNQKALNERLSKAVLQVAGYAAVLGLGLFAVSFLSPLAAWQTLIWALLAIGAGLFIILPLSLIICIDRVAHKIIEEQLEKIHDIDVWMREFYSDARLADIQDGMLASIPTVDADDSVKTKAFH